MSKSKEKIKVGVLVFDEVDLLDVTGPIEVFNAVRVKKSKQPKEIEVHLSRRIEKLYEGQEKIFETKLVSINENSVITTTSGTNLVADYNLKTYKNANFKPSVWVIPGGKGIHRERKKKEFIDWLSQAIDDAELSLSVCTGAYAVAMTGKLDGQIVTTHWRHFDLFQEEFPNVKLANNSRFEETNDIVTAGGVSSGIDGALQVVKRLVGDDLAHKAADLIVYPWMG